MKTNKSSPDVRQIIQDIRGAYVPTMAYDRLDEYFDQLGARDSPLENER
ncbi:MAG: hypothetical protein GYB50_25100 [Rhodobacteraceae bacterium]|nr:hypothetical protein [Paracoccaceae bacterium]